MAGKQPYQSLATSFISEAQSSLQSKKYREAIFAANAALKIDPGNREALAVKANAEAAELEYLKNETQLR